MTLTKTNAAQPAAVMLAQPLQQPAKDDAFAKAGPDVMPSAGERPTFAYESHAPEA